jgi:hypothetical protein
MIKIRSIKETAGYIKSLDSESCVTENAVRFLVATGRVPSVMIGKKHLIDADQVLLFFEESLSKIPEPKDDATESTDIRPIEVGRGKRRR